MGEAARRGGGQLKVQAQAVNPNCPNAANPFHRCAEYCPVAPPVPSAVKRSPGRAAAPRNGKVHSNGDAQNGIVHRNGDAQNGMVHRDGDAQNGMVHSDSNGDGDAQNGRVHSDGDARNGKVHNDGDAQNGWVRSDGDGDLQPRRHRRDRSGGSGGLPLHVFRELPSPHSFPSPAVREGSDGGGKKVDPRCPNASNPFHVCADHCLAKISDAGRSSEAGKSPISLFSRNSHRSSTSEDGSVKSRASNKVDPKCPNAGNPFHECSEHCTAKMKDVEKQRGIAKSPFTKAGKEISAVQNWKVDSKCPNAGNPFHVCAQYCFDHLNEPATKAANKPDSRKGKAVVKTQQTADINPDCVNASNPYHKCGEHCKTNGNR